MKVAPWSTTATPPSSSDDSDSETSSASSSSHSLSVGYYPSENTFSYEDMGCEEKTSADLSACFLPPTQGAWGTESLRRHLWRRDQMQCVPEQFCKLSIMLAWDADVGSDHAVPQASVDLNGHHQWMDKGLGEKTKLTSDKLENLIQRLETFLENEKSDQDDSPGSVWEVPSPHASDSSPRTLQACLEELDTCQDSSTTYRPQKSKDATRVLMSPLGLQEEELDPETRLRGSPTETPSTSSNTHTTFCPNLRWAFCWLRKRLFSRWRRDHHPGQAKKSCSLRVNRIQPQEGLQN
uniref:uncharacterized protein C12orf71 homolog n=1 Tax=Jaculus jaculus TaxID=51337 RepID=UPI001E1B5314|nr:uncharacterized protein C12orf71 homolog [Jaculus jaculus]